jgi:hypothetical protein
MDNGTTYNEHTPQRVRDILESARIGRRRVRLFYGDTNTPDFERTHKRKPEPGKSWNEENDVTGYVGRSMGPTKAPILVHNSRSMGGGVILDACIVRILVEGREAYRHPGYKVPSITIGPFPQPITSAMGRRLTVAAAIDGEAFANFETMAKAERWAAFMRGDRMTK